MRRIVLLATVAALMAVMLVMSAAPGFGHARECKGRDSIYRTTDQNVDPAAVAIDENGNRDGKVCLSRRGGFFYENHIH